MPKKQTNSLKSRDSPPKKRKRNSEQSDIEIIEVAGTYYRHLIYRPYRSLIISIGVRPKLTSSKSNDPSRQSLPIINPSMLTSLHVLQSLNALPVANRCRSTPSTPTLTTSARLSYPLLAPLPGARTKQQSCCCRPDPRRHRNRSGLSSWVERRKMQDLVRGRAKGSLGIFINERT